MRLNNFIILGLFLSIGVYGFVGCRKKKDTSAKIYVKDSNNNGVSNARVVLYPTGTVPGGEINVDVYDTSYTNPEGYATFHFNETYQLGQAGVVVLNIEATKDGSAGQGVIKVEEEVQSETTVFIQ